MTKPVELWYDDTCASWAARIYSRVFHGTYEECVAWLRGNNEEIP